MFNHFERIKEEILTLKWCLGELYIYIFITKRITLFKTKKLSEGTVSSYTKKPQSEERSKQWRSTGCVAKIHAYSKKQE